MQTQVTPIRVPSDIAADIEDLVAAIREAADKQGQAANDAVRVVRPKTKEMVEGGVDVLFLVVGAGFTWFTAKWFDSFVWPELEKRLQKPSTQAVDFLFDSLLGNSADRKK